MPLFSYTYAIPYLTIIFLLFILYNYECKKSTKIISIAFSFVILLIFIGLRGHLYTDFINYFPFFQSLPTITHLSWSYIETSEFESGFVFYSSLFKTFIPDYYCWIFINTLIDLIILTWAFRKYSYSVMWSYIFFFSFMGLLIEANLLRNVKSIMLFLLSLPYLQERKFLPYLFLNMIGITFHSSSVLYILAYFILNKQLTRKSLIIIFIVINIIFFFNIHIISGLIKWCSDWIPSSRGFSMLLRYIDNSEEQYPLSIGYIERTSAYIITMIYYNKLIKKNSTNIILCNSLFLYYIIFYISTEISILSSRIPLLFIFSYWFVFPNILSLVRNELRTKIYLLTFTFCCIKLSFSTNCIIHKYDNWLMGGIETFEYRKSIYLNNPETQ